MSTSPLVRCRCPRGSIPSTNGGDHVIFVGVDWAETHHDIGDVCVDKRANNSKLVWANA
jgi:hypothetical protein